MKRIYAYFGSILLLSTITSCSDDITGNDLKLDGTGQAETVLQCTDAINSIAFATSGDWTATVSYKDSEDTNWIALLDESGKGNATLRYLVDPNTTDELREAEIKIVSGTSEITYRVKQQPENYDTNDALSDLSMFNQNSVPLGFGMKMEKGFDKKLVKKAIFRTNSYGDSKLINDYTGKFGLNTSYYLSSSSSAETESELLFQDAAEEQSRNIEASLKVNVAYGIFKMDLNGNFKMFGSNKVDTYTYGVIATHPLGSYSLDYDLVQSDYETLSDIIASSSEDAVEASAAVKLLFNSQFLDLKNKIEKSVKDGETYSAGTSNALKTLLDKLDKDYGPAFISSTDVGGSAELNYSFNKEEGLDTLRIHGDLTIGVNALLKVDVKASADYEATMGTHIQSATLSARIKGGSAAANRQVLKNFGDMISSKESSKTPVNFSQMIDTLSDWYDSMSLDSSSTFTCINYYPTPVWILFDEDAQDIIKAYFKDRYPNTEDDKCPYMFDVQEMINSY